MENGVNARGISKMRKPTRREHKKMRRGRARGPGLLAVDGHMSVHGQGLSGKYPYRYPLQPPHHTKSSKHQRLEACRKARTREGRKNMRHFFLDLLHRFGDYQGRRAVKGGRCFVAIESMGRVDLGCSRKYAHVRWAQYIVVRRRDGDRCQEHYHILFRTRRAHHAYIVVRGRDGDRC